MAMGAIHTMLYHMTSHAFRVLTKPEALLTKTSFSPNLIYPNGFKNRVNHLFHRNYLKLSKDSKFVKAL
jgi:hypothetical protein